MIGIHTSVKTLSFFVINFLSLLDKISSFSKGGIEFRIIEGVSNIRSISSIISLNKESFNFLNFLSNFSCLILLSCVQIISKSFHTYGIMNLEQYPAPIKEFHINPA